MKKIASLALAILMVVGVFSGCSKSTSATKNENITLHVLTHWTNLTSTELKTFADSFKTKTGITVLYEAITDYDDTAKTRLSSDNYGDVLEIPNGVPNSDLGLFFTKLGKNTDSDIKDFSFTDATGKAVKNSDGTYNVYGITYGLGLEGAVYNKAVFTKAGITSFPKTVDEMYADAPKLKAAGAVPLATNFAAKWTLSQYSTLAQQAADDPNYWNTMYQQTDPFSADKPYGQVMAMLNKFVSSGWVEKDLTTTDWEQSKADCGSGKTAMMFLGTWAISQVQGAATNKDDIGFAPIPVNNSGNLTSVAGADYFMGVSNKSKYQAAAREYVFDFLNSSFAADEGFAPVSKTVKSTNPAIKAFLDTGVKIIYPVVGTTGKESDNYTKIANDASIDFWGGAFLQPVCLAALQGQTQYSASVDSLNKAWDAAKTKDGF